jgi:hypothetical protein
VTAPPPPTQSVDANLRAVWQAGRLRWRLLPQARLVYDRIRAQWGQDPFLINCHRNFTKSTLALTVCDEECRRAAKTPAAILCDTKAHALAIVEEKFGEYLSDCPEELKPKVHLTQRGFYFEYPNQSRLWLFGADDHRHVKTLRGLGFRVLCIDEAGHVEGSRGITLKVIVRSIALPALAKFTRANPGRQGQLVLATTSPMDEVHDFWSLWDDSPPEARFTMPLEANPDFSEEYKKARARECGGRSTVDYRREYGCERISLADAVPLPQVTQARIDGTDGKPALVQQLAMPTEAREWVCGQDVGGRHLTADLWGYYERADDTIRIMREWAAANVGTKEIADALRTEEASLFGLRCSYDEFQKALRTAEIEQDPGARALAFKAVDAMVCYPEYFERWSDPNNVIFLHDLDVDHGIQFYPTQKDEKAAQLGELRREIAAARIVIDVSCTRTILTLKKARWKQTATKQPQWDYNPEIGHADLLDALLYLVRNVRRRPYPAVEHTVYDAAGVPRPDIVGLKSKGLRDLARRLRDSSEEPLQDFEG